MSQVPLDELPRRWCGILLQQTLQASDIRLEVLARRSRAIRGCSVDPAAGISARTSCTSWPQVSAGPSRAASRRLSLNTSSRLPPAGRMRARSGSVSGGIAASDVSAITLNSSPEPRSSGSNDSWAQPVSYGVSASSGGRVRRRTPPSPIEPSGSTSTAPGARSANPSSRPRASSTVRLVPRPGTGSGTNLACCCRAVSTTSPHPSQRAIGRTTEEHQRHRSPRASWMAPHPVFCCSSGPEQSPFRQRPNPPGPRRGRCSRCASSGASDPD